MGNSNCASKPQPDTSNICNVSVGNYEPSPMPHFCTLEGVGGDSHRRDFCSQMSVAGEWGNPQATDTGGCAYNDCNNYQDIGSGCCNGCCGIVGSKLKCQRLKFTGDPITCCFNNYECNTANNNCFSDSKQQNTCADGQNGQPNYRSIRSSDCQDALYQYCTGTLSTDDYNSVEWLSRWAPNGDPNASNSCVTALRYNIFSVDSNPCYQGLPPEAGVCNNPVIEPINSSGYFWASSVVSGALQHYQDNGFQIGTLPGLPGYNPFQDLLYNQVCCPYPGVCQAGLAQACSTSTAQRMSLNPLLTQWCGCHLPTTEYQSYSVQYNIPPQCTPTCNRYGNIPLVGINAQPINCTQDICLIDDITVNLINSTVAGGLNFNQICGNCGAEAQCSCIVSNDTVDVENSTVGGNFVPIAEGCGSVSCTQPNPSSVAGPAVLNVPCNSGTINPYTEYEAELAANQELAYRIGMIETILVVLVVLVLIFLGLYFFGR